MPSISEINAATKNGTLLNPSYSIGSRTQMKLTPIRNLPPKDYVIKRFDIMAGNLTLLCATGCSGKTMFAQYLATCVSNGLPLFGKFYTKKGGVVHIDQEQSENQTLLRYVRIANGLGATEIDIERDTLQKRFDDPSVELQKVENELIALCTNKSMCIIDSLKACSVAEENSGQIETVLKMMKRVAEKSKCAVVCVCHKGKSNGKSKQSPRGHSSIYDSADAQIDLDCKDGIYEIECAKARDQWWLGASYTLQDVGEFCDDQNCSEGLQFNLIGDAIKTAKLSQRDKIIEALSSGECMKQGDLLKAVGGDRTKALELVHTMVSSDELNEIKGAKGSLLYSLTENMRNYK